ncbi:two component transcriptional regulator, LuxR family [Actinacidiphila yanglinensis]|uniref:Two component transcriptional regulator, LuxR family n=1 Tax=Actinacidiphila yanglinensis TaxID=310779 RepID=A0A1H6AL69_9ACTN|nr:response regulator transcription factor [Actinacidiphila yanglinensis]SEG49142.1 two component transcriptional regulator, LuxR family [Actinacidiphila yanglinensis]
MAEGLASDGRIRILIAEDMHLLREALVGLLSAEPDMAVVAEVDDGARIVPTALTHRPDVAIIDIGMPGLDGVEASIGLRTALPGCKVVILTALTAPGQLRRALRAQVAGFLPKAARAAELTSAIRTVAAGGRVIDSDLAVAALETPASPLTQRETEVLRLSATGAQPAEIAQRLFITYGTARNYLTSAVGKLSARNRVDAIRIATEAGWI